MDGPLTRLLLPAEPRRLPGHRGLKVCLRAVHTLAAGVLVGAWLLDAPDPARATWLWATIASGAAMLLLDLVESGAFLLQLRGAVLLAKLALLAGLPMYGNAGGEVLAGLFLVAVVSSHAPSRWRYLVLLGRSRVTGATTKG